MTLRHEPILAEDFGARPNSPQIACLQELRGSDIVVLILGEHYGFVPPGASLSATHQEYREARETKPVLAFVQQGIRRMPQRHAVRVRLAMRAEDLAAQVGRWGTVSEDGTGCVLEMNVDDLDWPVMVLAGSGADFVVESPPELAEKVAEVGARFSRAG